jgi:MASE1
MTEEKGAGRKRSRRVPGTAWPFPSGDSSRLAQGPIPSTFAEPTSLESRLTQLRPWRQLAVLSFITAMYFIAGKVGLSLANLNSSISLVWPATGMAIAAVVLLGYRVWPAIALGAFLVNLTTTGRLAPSLGVVMGNTLEALAGA